MKIRALTNNRYIHRQTDVNANRALTGKNTHIDFTDKRVTEKTDHRQTQTQINRGLIDRQKDRDTDIQGNHIQTDRHKQTGASQTRRHKQTVNHCLNRKFYNRFNPRSN